MKKFFSLTLLAAAMWAPSAWAAPRLTPERLEAEIGTRVMRVPEFEFIRAEAEKLGAKVYLFGGTAAAYSHYVREDLLREAGDERFPEHRFDYDYTNIFRSTQDLDVVIDGTAEQAEALERALVSKYPHFIGDKGAGWEVRPLRVERGAKEAILGNPNFLNQHTDSHSTGLVELTKPAANTSAVRDVRDWENKKPQFLRDVTEAKLHYYFNPQHGTTTRALEGLNPPILSVIRYLTKAFQYGLEMRSEDLPLIRKIIREFNPNDLDNDYLQKWVEKNGKKLFQHSVNIEYAWNTLEDLGLRKKLAAINDDPHQVESLSWWMNKEPLRTKPIGEGNGATAAEIAKKLKLPKLVVAHETNSYLAYESITRQRGGELNALISRDDIPGEAAAYGDGFYSQVGRQGARGTGLTIRMEIDPRAREGTDFVIFLPEKYVVLTNKSAIKVISEQIDISMPEYFRMLAEGKSFSSDDRALLEQFHRRAAKHASLSPPDEAAILKIVRDQLKRPNPRPAVVSEWLRLPAASKYPDIMDALLKQADQTMLEMLARDVFSRPEWQDRPELVQQLIDKGKGPVHAELFLNAFSKPHWAQHPELVAQFFGPGAPKSAEPSPSAAPKRNRAPSWSLSAEALFAQGILPQPAWAAHPELVKAAMAKVTDSFVLTLYAGGLSAPHWAKHPDLLKPLIESGHQNVHNLLASSAFTTSEWAKHPQLLEQLIEAADQQTLRSITRLFELPFWRENTELQKKVFDKGEGPVRVLLAQALGPDSKVTDFRSLIREAIKKGPSFLRSEAADVLMTKKWWPEKELMQALIDKKDVQAIETVANRIPGEYFDEAPAILDQLLRSKSQKIQRAAVVNIFYRSERPPREIRSLDWLLANGSDSVVRAMATWIKRSDEAERLKYVKTLLDRNEKAMDEIISNEILPDANTTDQADTIRTIIRRGDRHNITQLVKRVLDDEKWANHPDLISEVIQASTPLALRELEWPIFSQKFWLDRHDLIVQMLERADGPGAVGMERHIHDFSWEQQKAIYEKVLAGGTKQGRENVARMVLTFAHLEKSIEFAKPLLQEGDPQVQKRLRASFAPVWKTMRPIDPEFLALLKAKPSSPSPSTCAGKFANLASTTP